MYRLVVTLIASAWVAVAASPSFAGPRVPAQQPAGAIPLYDGVAPGSEDATQVEVATPWEGRSIVRNVTRPTLTPVLPRVRNSTRAAVLVIPGGGFHFLSMDLEGWPVARWLADQGIAAFVLKYRVEPTPAGEDEFRRLLAERFKPELWIGGTPPYVQDAIGKARADAQAALRAIRASAEKWHVDPARVGILGFSAGAITAVGVALADASDARPDFLASLYGTMLPVTPPPHAQPLFVAVASDDPAFGKQGFGLAESWQRAGGSVELHWYEGGGHGFGADKKGTTSDLWFQEFLAWMKARGLLGHNAK